MRRLVALLAVLLAGCTQASHPAGHPVAQVTVPPSIQPVESPSPSPTEAASPTPTPSSVPFVDLPLTTLDFSCKLPVTWDDAQLNDFFISFPDRTVTLDPNSHGVYFDRAFSRWLPVGSYAVSPDGSKYASIEAVNAEFVLHVVEIVSGKETLIHLSSQLFTGQPFVFHYSADGIYLTQGVDRLFPGLWLVNPVSGAIQQISNDLYPIDWAGNGVIWTQRINPDDPHPIVTGTSMGTLPDEIDRVDLRTGARTEWLYEPGRWVGIIGLDGQGIPLISSSLRWDFSTDVDGAVFLVGAANSKKLIYQGPVAPWLGGGFTDAHGIWIGSQRGIYLYTNSGAIEKVSDHPGGVANGCF